MSRGQVMGKGFAAFVVQSECCHPGCEARFEKLLDQAFLVRCPKHRTAKERAKANTRMRTGAGGKLVPRKWGEAEPTRRGNRKQVA